MYYHRDRPNLQFLFQKVIKWYALPKTKWFLFWSLNKQEEMVVISLMINQSDRQTADPNKQKSPLKTPYLMSKSKTHRTINLKIAQRR